VEPAEVEAAAFAPGDPAVEDELTGGGELAALHLWRLRQKTLFHPKRILHRPIPQTS